ncbi:arginine deiminase [Brevibacillus sp. SYP-B805]|uniref:arginine deiminase n=1 Tax=Brevibacillus sp. SYP-B805 TaxID=1578199 RepID=UPI0013ED4FAE|nr:arginine deiminase [Brevibacillus sp. SYP-B805]NGQ97496.1 arginine deiminase [Brevibacillus sp. SYP-B805]
MKHPLHITSEIGELRTVLLHRPGKEVENLTPEYLERLLFDDIPYLPAIQKEHDYFAQALRNRGIEVVYLEKLVAETLSSNEIREQFVDDLLEESKANINGAFHHLKEYLLSLPNEKLVEQVMAGIRKNEIQEEKKIHLYEIMEDHYPFYLDPMPNLYFTRDPAAVIGDGISINRMNRGARKRESLFMEYIIRYHPRYASHKIPIWFNREFRFSMEGGDQLVLSKNVLAIGVSQRTTAQAIERIALSLFAGQKDIRKVVAVEIPKSRAFMHLDTVFTMVDRDKFTVHPAILGPYGEMRIFILEPGEEKGTVKITERNNLIQTLKEVLDLQEVDLIPCGGGDSIASAREQWNDGSNTLAIAPGVVITYDRNYVSNQLLREHGVEVIEVPSSELARGRGGPRCMSMPLIRDDI